MSAPPDSFERLLNFRDVGGVATREGGRVKQRLLYRSAAPLRLPDRDVQAIRRLGLRSLCDLRAPEETKRQRAASLEADGVPTFRVPLHAHATPDGSRRKALGFFFGAGASDRFRAFLGGYYREIVFERAGQIGAVVEKMADARHLPMLVFCTAGKDRTGILVALLLLALGVPYEAVVEDYLASNVAWQARLDRSLRIARFVTLLRGPEARIRFVLTVHREFLDDLHEEILTRHGSAEAYLREACGVEAATLERLRGLLVEPPSRAA